MGRKHRHRPHQGGDRAPQKPKKALVNESPALDPQLLSLQYLRAGGGLTPQYVSEVMRQADTGYIWRLIDLGDEQKQKDCHLGSVLYRRENAPTSLDFQVIPSSDRPRAVRLAAFVEDAIRRLGSYNLMHYAREVRDNARDFGGLIAHSNGAVFYGHGVSEIIWERVGRYLLPIAAVPIQPRRFVYAQEDGGFRWWDAMGSSSSQHPYPGLDLLSDFPLGKFVVHRPRINGSIGPREGYIRPLMWASMYRTWGIGDWAKLAELAWKPYRWGEYEREATKEDIAALRKALQYLVTNAWTLIPKTTKLNVQYAGGGGSGRGGQNSHADWCAFLAAEMSKLVLGATLSVEQGRVGSNALGNVHADVARSILEYDARALEASVKRYIIAPLVWLNFGQNVPVPDFRFLTEETADIDKISAAIQRLSPASKSGAGLAMSARWARMALGMPELEEGEELVGGGVYKKPVLETQVAPQAAPDDGTPEVQATVLERACERALYAYRLDKVLRGLRVRRDGQVKPVMVES